ncbi:zinc-binding dehydrogenase [Nocardiopsis sp. MG754419]|uniref:zinc-binding dehydrogenase n=1 Tax=Nocardiopsis sp. MG754419 TaxID=2259865 RepID=UPI001BAE2DA2|nr:zinc-binding dehydrogenase [Nocardiopsis sp. MG754419]MBR8742689.1 Zn-dependent oxidoreductase [Nocardiopsis sp. MG754419]
MRTLPRTMRAARLTRHGGPEALELVELPLPTPESGQVLVRVSAAALNNTDLWTREGAYGLPEDPHAKAGWRGRVEFPRVQGADIVGDVAQVGPGVDPALVGSRVLVDPALYGGTGPHAHPVGLLGSERDGGYAEYTLVAADRVHSMENANLTDAELATLPTAYGTALGMLERGGVRRGETVLVTGASGGVGLALVQLARERGARVIALTSAGKVSAVRAAGADATLVRGGRVWPELRAHAPEGVDAVLDVVAGDLVEHGLPHLREGGRWIVAGALGGHGAAFDIRRLYLHNRALIGSSMHTPAHFDLLVDIARRGGVAPVIAARYPLVEVHRAQAELASRAHVGKIVLDLAG